MSGVLEPSGDYTHLQEEKTLECLPSFSFGATIKRKECSLWDQILSFYSYPNFKTASFTVQPVLKATCIKQSPVFKGQFPGPKEGK